MAKPKPSRKPKRRRKSRKSGLFENSLVKACAGLSLLVLLVVLAGLLARFLISSPKPLTSSRPLALTPAAKPPVAKIPPFEIYPHKEIPAPKRLPKTITPELKQLPRIAIIIDDLGYDRKIAKKFISLHAPITFSILPYSPYRKTISRLAHENGLDTMLHLPMEPMEYPGVNPGPGTLLNSMSPDQLIRQLEKDLDEVPDIKGVNNHMGSKMTAESSQMYQIFSVLKKKGLFFIDSRTTAQTLCKPSARLFQIPFAQRDVFLDHRQDPAFIRRQLKELVRIAQQHGQAIGIGHPHTITYDILREMLPDLQKKVLLVPASKLVRPVG